MDISYQNVFPDIPEVELWSLLVLDAFNIRVPDPLDIELRSLYSGFANRQQLVCQSNNLEVCNNLVVHRRGKPPLRSSSIENPLLSIARLTATSSAPKLRTCCAMA